ncbi:MAG: sugar phosphate nucleotidyltransferase [Patescibacteria group bacterium]|nr:sugar phosphate nucleotidyltransferase [Patescibacteria group bacterium]
MIRKVVVLAGGKGTRMGNLTADRPKHLIPVNGWPFIYYLLNNLLKAGLTEIFLMVGYKKERWDNFQETLDFKINIIDQTERVNGKYGSACPVEAAEPEVSGENFIAVNGDNLYSIEDIKAISQDDQLNYVAGYHHEDPTKYGVLISDSDGYLKEIKEKSPKPITNLINSGLYKFTPRYFDEVKKIELSPRGEYEITDVITRLAKQRLVKVYELKDYWYDFGKPEDIDKVSKFLKTQTS